MTKRIVFVTGTRADFGKLKPIIKACGEIESIEIYVFVTGMHMLELYGSTVQEVQREGYENVYAFINQKIDDPMDEILAKTISGFSDYTKEIKPDLIIVHGDRIESFGAAIVGLLNNVIVAHVEGGELSGTVDESLRHATSKLAHHHFVANQDAAKRLLQLGEINDRVHVIGSPELDIMLSKNLPKLTEVRRRYEITFRHYGIAILHPVTTELNQSRTNVRNFIAAIQNSNEKYVVILPNNDQGSRDILDELGSLEHDKSFKILPSMRFEYFLTLMKNAQLIVGNSSVGVRQATVYGVPAVNIGSRQYRRAQAPTIIDCDYSPENIVRAIMRAKKLKRVTTLQFGTGNSALAFKNIVQDTSFWEIDLQKVFSDLVAPIK